VTTDTRIDTSKLPDLLAQTLGNEKAKAAIDGALEELGLGRPTRITMEQALAVLERVAATPGIVGVTARFAKSRLHLASL